MVSDWNEKKMVCIDSEGQYLLNFKDKELGIAKSLTEMATLIREGASDEKEQGIRYMEYLADCLKTGKLEVKWNISQEIYYEICERN